MMPKRNGWGAGEQGGNGQLLKHPSLRSMAGSDPEDHQGLRRFQADLEPAQCRLGELAAHRGLDAACAEDTSRLLTGHTAENPSRCTRVALSLLKQQSTRPEPGTDACARAGTRTTGSKSGPPDFAGAPIAGGYCPACDNAIVSIGKLRQIRCSDPLQRCHATGA
jgi:hypothetical protein